MANLRRANSKAGKRRNDRAAIVMPSFDPDRGRIDCLVPKEPPLDYLPTGPEPRRIEKLPNVIEARRPQLCECGSRDFIQIGPRWVCAACSPQARKPQPPAPAREIVTIPESLTSQAAELRKAWELIQAKREAAGLTRGPAITKPRKQPAAKAASLYPESVTFYSHMGVAAARRFSKLGGGWRAYALAKALDPKGTGKIARDDLKGYALSLGVNVRSFERWIKQARNAGLFYTDVQTARGQWMIVMANPGIAAAALQCETVGRCVTLAAADLIGNGWKARVWAAYDAIHNGQPISRERMQKIINVAVSTQRYRDAQAGVKRVRNFAKSNRKTTPDQLRGLREFELLGNHKGVFIDRAGFINWRLPNSYQYMKALRGGKGRGRKANRIIRAIQSNDGLSNMRQALSYQEEYNREIVTLFNRTPGKRKSSLKKLGKIDNRKVREVYELSHTAPSGAVIWAHCPV